MIAGPVRGRRWNEECPRQDSNLRPCLRRAVLYPLSYGGSSRPGKNVSAPDGPAGGGPQGAGRGTPPRSASIAAIVRVSADWAPAMAEARLRTAGRPA